MPVSRISMLVGVFVAVAAWMAVYYITPDALLSPGEVTLVAAVAGFLTEIGVRVRGRRR